MLERMVMDSKMKCPCEMGEVAEDENDEHGEDKTEENEKEENKVAKGSTWQRQVAHWRIATCRNCVYERIWDLGCECVHT